MDQGTISVDGDIVKISSPNDAHTLGLRMIHPGDLTGSRYDRG